MKVLIVESSGPPFIIRRPHHYPYLLYILNGDLYLNFGVKTCGMFEQTLDFLGCRPRSLLVKAFKNCKNKKGSLLTGILDPWDPKWLDATSETQTTLPREQCKPSQGMSLK